LDGCLMGAVKINGTTSGFTQLVAAAVADSETLTLPNGGGTLLPMEGGKILQIVRATDTTQRSTTSTTFVDANLSVTITPQKNDSAILLIAAFMGESFNSSSDALVTSYRITDNSGNAISGSEAHNIGTQNVTGSGTREHFAPVTIIARATPATTSAVTYKLQFRSPGGVALAICLNSTTTAQLYAIEVSA
jgi:hypothetical protein